MSRTRPAMQGKKNTPSTFHPSYPLQLRAVHLEPSGVEINGRPGERGGGWEVGGVGRKSDGE